MLTDHRPHGDGLVSFGFVDELAARGHEVHVAAGRVDLRSGTSDSLRLHSIPLMGGGVLGARLRYWSGVRRLYRSLSAHERFDLVHQLTPVEVGVTLGLADARTPIVLGPYVSDWIPGEDPATRQHPVAERLKPALRAAQQRSATVLLVSNPAARRHIAWRRGVPVHELPLGVDARIWRPSIRPMADGVGQDILFLASLDTRKGIHVLLDAFSELAPRYPHAQLVVAGGGSEATDVARRTQSSPALLRVKLLGPLDRQGALEAMQACDVYCLPSFGEPFGLTALEAMACSKPIVATEAGGLRYVVPDQGGRKVAPGNARALAGALAELLEDRGLRRQMGAYNRSLVEERYSWTSVVDRLEAIYDEALREPSRRHSNTSNQQTPDDRRS